MQIIIGGKEAFIKKNQSFQFILENRLFTGSDNYSMTITFPLKGCPKNIAIFGHIQRKDVEKGKVVFDCEIRDRDFYQAGSITITEISDIEVKTQFLEGKSEQNYDTTFDDVYINELQLGYPSKRTASQYNPNECLQSYPHSYWIPLPWVNNTSGNLQNAMTYDTKTGKYKWTETSGDLSFQPYLCYIIERICESQDYECDIEELKASDFANLLICNCLPAAWDMTDFAEALPHWSITEFFEQLEYFLMGEFSIDHKEKTVTFHFSVNEIEASGVEVIDEVVDAYTVEVQHDDESSYIGRMNMEYADNDNRLWPYRSCQWYVDSHSKTSYNTLNELLAFAKTLKTAGVYPTPRGTGYSYYRGYPRTSMGHRLFYAIDVKTYFIMYCYKSELVTTHDHGSTKFNWYRYYYRLEPVNQFGKLMVDDDADTIELKIVPAWIDDTDEDNGRCIFLECGEMDDNASMTTDGDNTTVGGFGGRHYSYQR